ncbi:MAG TPA: bifunctional methylenetetrahydrofolate dehydrogenase/methenyltetrahydrofolate cyclohydrolase FolD [Stellaceae bacterium]|nr:bifunctional methylenetetrahydrofolate dehydrogenase/methenyltetrahydrofolate cyclohydrolase FolD [Stellaceae bacterium]
MAQATIIDGQAIAARLRERLAATAGALRAQHGMTPGLATIIVGDDPASRIYVRSKARACLETGLASFEHRLPAEATEGELIRLIESLNRDERVDGILVQLPLPDAMAVPTVLSAVDPEKDVDGFHPLNVGRLWSGQRSLVPCTPLGCLMLLRSVHSDLTGAEAVVLGRSSIVGRPMAALLVTADCTVTVTHSRTRDVAGIARRADIVIAALGRPAIVTAAWIKPGATVIDVGTHRITDSAGNRGLVGDVDFAAVRKTAGAITPVPGGVGPMTIACVLRNTVIAACRRRGLAEPELAEPELT